MVRRAGEAPPRLDHAAHGAGELGALGEQEREVEEAGAHPRARRGVGVAGELEQGPPVLRAERDGAPVAVEHPQADHPLVEGAGARQVGHGEGDRADGEMRGFRIR